jgi:hypothetical protein
MLLVHKRLALVGVSPASPSSCSFSSSDPASLPRCCSIIVISFAPGHKKRMSSCASRPALSLPLCVCVHLSSPPSTSPRQLQSAKKNKQLSLPTLRSGIILIAVSAMESGTSGKKHVPAAAAAVYNRVVKVD